MAVELWFGGNDQFPGGFRSYYETLGEAMTQAVADIHADRSPGPVRIQDADGNVLADRAALEDAADE